MTQAAATTAPAPAPYEPDDYVAGENTWREHFMQLAIRELDRDQLATPENDGTMARLIHKVADLSQACGEKPGLQVFAEAVKVAMLAMRIAIDGDEAYTLLRKSNVLDAMDVERCEGRPEDVPSPVPEGPTYTIHGHQIMVSAQGAPNYWVNATIGDWEKAKKAGASVRHTYVKKD